MEIKQRQIRAVFTDTTIRVYQAYSNKIADTAVQAGTFVSPPFRLERISWIKPSFLWMMYRSGWGIKQGQEKVLAIDITREGFEWALRNSCLSHFEPKIFTSYEEWFEIKQYSPVRIQWDPERDIWLNKLDYRSIQIGLSAEAVNRYVNKWIVRIEEITPVCNEIQSVLKDKKTDRSMDMLPKEEYPLSDSAALDIGTM
jgi:hypothetical protein